MKALKLTTLIALGITTSTVAMANEGDSLFKRFTNPAAVSAEVGTLGYGANIAWSATPTTEVQAGWAGGSFSTDVDVDDINYEVDVDFSNPYLGVQMRPAANWFTVGTGVIVPDNEIKLKGKPTVNGGQTSYRINGKEYTLDELGTVDGKVSYKNTLAPYLTVGFRPNSNNRWGVFGEVGAAYMGDIEAKVTASNINSTNSAVASKARQAVSEAQAEIDREIKDNEEYLRWYPIVKVGATVRF